MAGGGWGGGKISFWQIINQPEGLLLLRKARLLIYAGAQFLFINRGTSV